MISPRTLLLGGALLVSALTAGLLLAWRPDPGPDALPPPLALPTSPPSEPAPDPSPQLNREATGTLQRPTPATATPTPRRPPSSRAQPAPAASASAPAEPPTSRTPAPVLEPGATITLAPADNPATRLRHRDFRARLDRLTEGDKTDASFTVRSSAARQGCLTFEPTTLPGRVLRHRDFQLHLDPSDGTPLFAQDTAFCPEQRPGGTIVLRSANYPDRFLGRAGDFLNLTPTPVAFHIRPPL